jgi:hypothetical protein
VIWEKGAGETGSAPRSASAGPCGSLPGKATSAKEGPCGGQNAPRDPKGSGRSGQGMVKSLLATLMGEERGLSFGSTKPRPTGTTPAISCLRRFRGGPPRSSGAGVLNGAWKKDQEAWDLRCVYRAEREEEALGTGPPQDGRPVGDQSFRPFRVPTPSSADQPRSLRAGRRWWVLGEEAGKSSLPGPQPFKRAAKRALALGLCGNPDGKRP